MTIIELRSKKESDVEHILAWEPAKRAIIYKALHNTGERMEGIDNKIDNLLRQEIKGE